MAEDDKKDIENNEENEASEEDTPQLFEESPEGNKGEIQTRNELVGVSNKMEEFYLSYAMSVIVSRALPDVRDGLKPVHRRILYAMNTLGLRSNAKFRKSATVVGEVLGKYHPHGDTAVYDSMVRMAQDFAMRYELVNGQGNFGSVDGDNPAAMRYTEAKMQKISDELLADIDKNTVDFKDNYDGAHQEPVVLPSRVPQLLLNGTMGIAVAMATSIPPHNLKEVCEAVMHMCDNPDADIDAIMEFIKGPDFPTAGTIYDVDAIRTMYATGRGGITMRAKAEIVDYKKGKMAIIVTEIPYQVNKANLVTKIAELVRDKKITAISDLRDESNREGMRIVIELKKDAYPKKVLSQLYKMTPLQTRFNMNMIALVDGLQPRLLNIKQVLEYFIAHRKEVVVRRTQYELDKAEARAHILEGLKIALDNIDAVIETIRASETKEIAAEELMKKFKLSEAQAKAILEMRLQTLAGLERKKIEDEYNQLMELIKELKAILADSQKVIDIIKEETQEIIDKYGDERRTEIVPTALGKISSLDTVPNEPIIITVTDEGYIKRMPTSTFRAQNRGGKGIKGLTTKEDDQINLVKYAKNHDDVMFFTSYGKVYKIKAFEIPQASRTAKGQAIVNLLPVDKEERVTSILVVEHGSDKGKFLMMGTCDGTVKKTAFEDFKNVRQSGLIAIKLRDGDSLEWVKEVDPGNEVIIVAKNGKSIRFDEADVRATGRASMGVRGIKLKEGDEVVEMDVVSDENATLLVVMENGLGKATEVKSYRMQNRGGTGVLTAKITKKTGNVVGAKVLTEDMQSDLLLLSKNGQAMRMAVDKIPSRGRATQGVYLMRFKDDDSVVSISVLPNAEALKEEKDEDTTGVKTTKAKQESLV
jgi:DNA gyrase subunit A